MSELVKSSKFKAEFLVPLLALVVLQLFGKAAQNAPVTELQTAKVKLEKGSPNNNNNNNNNNPIVIDLTESPGAGAVKKEVIKTEPEIKVKISPDASPMDVVRQAQRLIGNQARWDQHHASRGGGGLEPIGINSEGLNQLRAAREYERMAALNRLAPPQITAFDELRILFEEVNMNSPGIHAQRWYWNSLPENSGMSLVKPEVRNAIYDTFEDIRALSENHRRFKLWHLMTR